MSATGTSFAPLREKLDAAVTAGDAGTIARRVKEALQETVKCGHGDPARAQRFTITPASGASNAWSKGKWNPAI